MPPAVVTDTGYICFRCHLRPTSILRTGFQQRRRDGALQKRQYAASYPLPFPAEPRTNKVSLRYIATDASPATASQKQTSNLSPPINLSGVEVSLLGGIVPVKKKLQTAATDLKRAGTNCDTATFGTVFDAAGLEASQANHPLINKFRSAYADRPYPEALKDLDLLSARTALSTQRVTDPRAVRLLEEFRVLKSGGDAKDKATQSPTKTRSQSSTTTKNQKNGSTTTPLIDSSPVADPVTKKLTKKQIRRLRKQAKEESIHSAVVVRRTPTIKGPMRKPLPAPVARKQAPTSRRDVSGEEGFFKVLPAPPNATTLDGSFIQQVPVELEEPPKVPGLSFDLSRVLFNPGVYHLQDPRSRVYNFDPYLENIMPISEFNFDALNPYITSSKDTVLRDVALKHNKRYVGSSSSMSAAMSQFHFLLSAWRPPDFTTLSQRIQPLKSFTIITRAPASIYLRWKDGVYAVDADKEYDTPNVLMMQGKSMEKLLTLEKDEFEAYRKPKAGDDAPAINSDPEAYHYSTVGDFLLRSQLDAHDPRLPGTGMFDLKTRAVAGIRMNMSEHEEGMHYQIKERFGEWESFDREYSDMIRSAFLKYSMQVRMGRMDGIFVAYHNIARIFGFQYISLAELDMALHGQTDTALGDTEFKLTVKLMNAVFEEATEAFPQRSLRLTFDTRDATKTEPNGRMRIFAEPMSEDEIDKVQDSGKQRVEDYEKNMAQGINPKKSSTSTGKTLEQIFSTDKQNPSTLESSEADHAFLDEVLAEHAKSDRKDSVEGKISAEQPLAAYELRIFNEINGQAVVRPKNFTEKDQWKVKFTFAQVAEEKARTLYRQTRARRAAALAWDESSRNGWFIQRIRDMSMSGKVWRAEQDERDAARQRIMLYSPATAAPPTDPDVVSD